MESVFSKTLKNLMIPTIFVVMVNAKINAIHVMMEAALMDGKRVFQMMISIIRISVFQTAAFIGVIKMHTRFVMENVSGLQKDFALVKIIMTNSSIVKPKA